jgi:hypothetical protein
VTDFSGYTPQTAASDALFSGETGSARPEEGRFPIGKSQAASEVIEITAATSTSTCTNEK